MIRKPNNLAAFTLVEVLATLTLAAIILPVAMRGISVAIAAADEARHRAEAASLADARLAELCATGDWQNGEFSGDCGTDWPDYRWEAEVESWDQSTLQQLTVSVEWTARGQDRSVTVSTLVYEATAE